MNPVAWLRRLPVTPGAGLLIGLMVLLLLGQATGLYDFQRHLGLDPSAVWHGEVWRLFTYALLPSSPLDLLLGAGILVWLGSWLERLWTPLECWLYGGLCTVSAGVVACLLFPHFTGPLGGTAIVAIGLVVAWGMLCGHERVLFAANWETTGRTAALVWGASLLFMAWFSCGRWFVLPMLGASAGAGWLYLSLRWRFLHRQSARFVGRERMSHLEL